jgi:UDP-glucose 4-epimerase
VKGIDASNDVWLVTGGAGYIGSHVVAAMTAQGRRVVVLDDLSTGLSSRVSVPLVVGSIFDRSLVQQLLIDHSICGVVHLAAKKSVEESIREAERYYRENVFGTMEILAAMRRCGIRKIIFSSSAAVYGQPPRRPLLESDPTVPITPYGRSKLISEWLIGDLAAQWGMRSVSLRYFNVAGCVQPHMADQASESLIASVCRALAAGGGPSIFGGDYETADGTCVRDFVHVEDIAEAHVLCTRLLASTSAFSAINLGSGTGYSVRQVVNRTLELTGVDRPVQILNRRPGDAEIAVASAARAEKLLGWRARKSLDDMITSTWDAIRRR